MVFSQYKMDKKNCCQCESPSEISTARDYCQRCKNYIYIPSHEEQLLKRLALILDSSSLCKSSQNVIFALASKDLKPIFNDSDLQRAEKSRTDLHNLIQKG